MNEHDPGMPRRAVLCGLLGALIAPGMLTTACAEPAAAPAGPEPEPVELAELAEIPVGGGSLVNGHGNFMVLLLRPSADTVKGLDAGCTHQGVVVDPPANGVIACSAHGSLFDAKDGSVLRGPARASLRQVTIKVADGKVYLLPRPTKK